MKRFLLFALVFAMPVSAQWNKDGKPAIDESWRKSSGNFGVMLMVINEPQKFIDDWKNPETPRMQPTSIAIRGKPIAGVLLFTGCAEYQGRCNAEVDYVVLKPDGSIYASDVGASLWKYRAPPGRQLQLSEAYLGIRIEPQDPAGTYKLQATVRDLNAKLEIVVSKTFVVEQ